jgi:hypothetical protein
MPAAKLTFPAICLTAITLLFGCAKNMVSDDTARARYDPSDKNAVRGMLDSLDAINKNSPVSYSANFYVDGTSERKKFKIKGNVQFDGNKKTMHIAFMDYIFGSTVSVFLMEGDTLRILLPVEKKLYVDNSKTINLANYGSGGMQFGVLYDLFTGKIPLPSSYTIRQGLSAKDGRGSLLILENAEFIETISFNENAPDKILLMDKNTRDRLEVYIKEIIDQGGRRFFGSLKIIAEQRSLTLDVTFNNVRLDIPVKVKTIKDIKLPENLQVIKM